MEPAKQAGPDWRANLASAAATMTLARPFVEKGDRRVEKQGSARPRYAEWGLKRVLDVTIALTALLFLAPLLALIAIALIVQDGYPIHYRHTRIGRNGERFGCLKFRSMVRDADAQLRKLLEESPAARAEWAETQKLRRDPRIHFVGSLLRKSSLDELPQLINVLRGEMSIVGPRPIVAEEMERYQDKLALYLAVRPGVTGLWQVSGRNDVSYDRRVSMDAEYVRSMSLGHDLFIVLKTGWVIFAGKGY